MKEEKYIKGLRQGVIEGIVRGKEGVKKYKGKGGYSAGWL